MTEKIIFNCPTEIKVGFSKRKETYSGLLGFMIYMNKGSQYGQENSFLNWIDTSIPVQYLKNDFQLGFVLNKNIKRVSSFSTTNNFRIFHPSGFEFEITPENFSLIASLSQISAGEILEPCIVAWQGAKVWLIPQSVQSEVSLKIINIESKKNKVKNTKYLSKKDLTKNNFYTHENGRTYFLFSNIKSPQRQNIRHNFSIPFEMNTQFPEYIELSSTLLNQLSNYDYSNCIIPFEENLNNDVIIDNEFMGKFVSLNESVPNGKIKSISDLNFLALPKNFKFIKFENNQENLNILKNSFKQILSIKNKQEYRKVLTPFVVYINGEPLSVLFSTFIKQGYLNIPNHLKIDNLSKVCGLDTLSFNNFLDINDDIEISLELISMKNKFHFLNLYPSELIKPISEEPFNKFFNSQKEDFSALDLLSNVKDIFISKIKNLSYDYSDFDIKSFNLLSEIVKNHNIPEDFLPSDIQNEFVYFNPQYKFR